MVNSTDLNLEKSSSDNPNPLYAKKDSDHLLNSTNSVEVPKTTQVSISRFNDKESSSTKSEDTLKEKSFFRGFKKSLTHVFKSAFDVDSRLEKELFGTEYKQAGAGGTHTEGVVSRDHQVKKESTSKSLRTQIKEALHGLYLTGGGEVIRSQNCQVLDPYFFLGQIEQLKEGKETKDQLKISLVRLHLKILGHQFSIGGEIKIRSRIIRTFIDKIKEFIFGEKVETVRLEWGFSSIAHAKIADSFGHFVKQKDSKEENAEGEIFERVLASFEECAKITDPRNEGELDQKVAAIVQRYEQGEPTTFVTGWEGHVLEVSLYKGVLCCSNRGIGGDPGISFYAIPEGKIDKKVITTLLRKLECQKEEGIDYFNNQMTKDLNLTKVDFLKTAAQKVHNCTFTQAKCGLRSLLFLLFLEQNLKSSSSMEMKDYLKFFTEHPEDMDGLAIYEATEKAHIKTQEIYKTWNLFNKKEQVAFFIDFVMNVNKKNEFKLLSKVMFKFGGKLEGNFSKSQYEKHIEELMEMVKSKEYPLSECVQQFPKGFSARTLDGLSLREPYELVETMLPLKSPGAFVIYQSGDQILASCKGPDGTIIHHHLEAKNGVYYLEGKEEPLKNLGDLLNVDERFKYPVWPRRM